ncbi:hypothetical protein BpHYR1_021303 [Brachionus plicatilis]|uniref:Uncharacterized protein n=1 Tax=Brachionus plicatilis TaxID=10195 RepID=A0A3M7SEI2_BRAPC|nr:hypothetical protein BpHYR1_021303 [Brachionus plicatilis]
MYQLLQFTEHVFEPIVTPLPRNIVVYLFIYLSLVGISFEFIVLMEEYGFVKNSMFLSNSSNDLLQGLKILSFDFRDLSQEINKTI